MPVPRELTSITFLLSNESNSAFRYFFTISFTFSGVWLGTKLEYEWCQCNANFSKNMLRLTGYWIYPSHGTELSSWDQGHSKHPRYHAATGKGSSCGSWAAVLCHRWARLDRSPLRDLRPWTAWLCTFLCKCPIRFYWKIQDICILLLSLNACNVSIDSRDQHPAMAIDEPSHHLNEVGHWLEYHPSKRSRV